jgi:hypothetical protein
VAIWCAACGGVACVIGDDQRMVSFVLLVMGVIVILSRAAWCWGEWRRHSETQNIPVQMSLLPEDALESSDEIRDFRPRLLTRLADSESLETQPELEIERMIVPRF